MANKKVYVAPPDSTGTGGYAISTFCDNTGGTDYILTWLDLTGSVEWNDLAAQITTNHNTYATTQGHTITSVDWWVPGPATTSKQGLLSAADKIKLDAITAPSALSYNYPSRTLNSAFQISATKVAQVSYAVDIACSLSLTTGQQGTAYLEYADDSGFTTNVVEVNRFVNGNTGTLTVGLALTQNATGTLAGVIPAGKYVRLRTQNNTGTPTFTFRRAQEVY